MDYEAATLRRDTRFADERRTAWLAVVAVVTFLLPIALIYCEKQVFPSMCPTLQPDPVSRGYGGVFFGLFLWPLAFLDGLNGAVAGLSALFQRRRAATAVSTLICAMIPLLQLSAGYWWGPLSRRFVG